MTHGDWILAASATTALAVAVGYAWAAPLWDRLAARYLADLVAGQKASGFEPLPLAPLLRWWGLLLVAVVLGLGLLGQALLAPPIVLVLVLLPRYVLQYRIGRRRRLLRDQLVGTTVALANSARAGQSLAQGFESVGAETPEPLAREIRRIVADYHRGRPLAEAIAEAKKRIDLESFTLFASAILVSLERGGRISDSLVEISRTLQEGQRLERKLEADTTTGRLVGLLLAAFPFVFLAGFYIVEPEMTSLIFTTLAGRVVLLVVMVIVYGTVLLVNKITRIDA